MRTPRLMNPIPRSALVLVACLAFAFAGPGGTDGTAQMKVSSSGLKPYFGPGPKARFGKRYAIRAGKILTMAISKDDAFGPVINQGVILVKDGKIEKVGREADISIPEGYEVVDATDCWAMPGFVDLHCHNQAATPLGWGSDLNDTVHQVNPGLRAVDTINPGNELVKNALAAGTTAALFIPGSGSNMGGWGAAVKTAGNSPEEIVIRFPGGLKVAQAGNPERNSDLGRTRMGMNFLIRNTLERGKAYHQAWKDYESGKTKAKPAYRADLENFRGLFEGLYPVIIHTQASQVFQSTMRIFHDQVKVPRFFQSHASFDSFENAPEIVKRGIYTDAGPRGFYLDPNTGRYLGLGMLWHEGGVENLTLNTDCPVIPQMEHWLCGTMAARYGLDERVAIRALTIKAAEALHLEDRIGSLEPGKDADIQIRTGSPLDVSAYVKKVFVYGLIAYDAEVERRF